MKYIWLLLLTACSSTLPEKCPPDILIDSIQTTWKTSEKDKIIMDRLRVTDEEAWSHIGIRLSQLGTLNREYLYWRSRAESLDTVLKDIEK